MLSKNYISQISSAVQGTAKTETIRTGFNALDQKLLGGLRPGCCYLFTGLEKSGKSSFLFNLVNERITSGSPTGMLSTEMDFMDVTKRLLTISRLHQTDTLGREFWQDKLETYFTFYGKSELATGMKFDFPKFVKALDEMEEEGTDLVVVDNLTTLGAEAGDYKVLGNLVNQLITHLKDKRMAVIFVIHVKQDTSIKETPKGIIKMIRDGKPEGVFSDSLTVISRPTLKDVYGGGQALSQLSGGVIMLWRPFQKYDSPKFQRMCMLIIDSHRYGPSCDISLEYDGASGKFWEVDK